MIYPASSSIDPEIIVLTSRVGTISVVPRYQCLPYPVTDIVCPDAMATVCTVVGDVDVEYTFEDKSENCRVI